MSVHAKANQTFLPEPLDSNLLMKDLAVLAGYAGSAYKGPTVNWSRDLQWIDLKRTDTQIFLAHSGDGENLSTIVAFRGTEINAPDFITDAQFRKEKERGIPGKWHRGFLGAARSAAPSVLSKTERSSSLTLVGHSLGGALAIVTAALLIEEMGTRIQSVVTFGAPRCCSLRASRWLEKMLPPMSEKEQRRAFPVGQFISTNRIIRVEHHRDVIPHVPMAILNYRHCGKQFAIPRPTGSGPASEDGQRRDDRERLRWRLKGLKGHSIKGYEDLLKRLGEIQIFQRFRQAAVRSRATYQELIGDDRKRVNVTPSVEGGDRQFGGDTIRRLAEDWRMLILPKGQSQLWPIVWAIEHLSNDESVGQRARALASDIREVVVRQTLHSNSEFLRKSGLENLADFLEVCDEGSTRHREMQRLLDGSPAVTKELVQAALELGRLAESLDEITRSICIEDE